MQCSTIFLQALASQIQHGVHLVRRIVMVYRASMYLDKDYTEILKIKIPDTLLCMAVDDDCLNKLVVLNDIMTSMEMTAEEVTIINSLNHMIEHIFQNPFHRSPTTYPNKLLPQSYNLAFTFYKTHSYPAPSYRTSVTNCGALI
jgi:hypothetical protein